MKNERLRKWIATIVFAALGLVVIGFSVKLAYDVMSILFPQNLTMRIMAIALFDGGVIGWLMTYISKAKGTPQRGISITMTVLDFIGVAAMAIAGIFMGGQTLATTPLWVGNLVVWATIVATVLNAGAYYYFHANDPEVREEIQAQELEDTLNEEALDQARRQVEMRAQALGAIMANRVTARLKYRMRLPMTDQEVNEWKNESIEAQAYDIPALPYTRPIGFWDQVRSFFGKRQSEPQSSMPQSKNSTDSSEQDPDRTQPLPPLNE